MRVCRHLLPLLLVAAAFGADGAKPEERDLALARSIRGVYRTLPEDSPARYAADQIASRFWYSLELGRLEGTIPATARQLLAFKTPSTRSHTRQHGNAPHVASQAGETPQACEKAWKNLPRWNAFRSVSGVDGADGGGEREGGNVPETPVSSQYRKGGNDDIMSCSLSGSQRRMERIVWRRKTMGRS